MAGGTLIVVCVYAFALWLGLYLIARDPRSPRLVLTGAGLAAYALALACVLLNDNAPPPLDLLISRLRMSLLLTPALCWSGALLSLLPDDDAWRGRLLRPYCIALPVVAGGLFVASGAGDLFGRAGALLLVGTAILAPMLAVALRVMRAERNERHTAVGLIVVCSLFLALSVALVVVPFGWVPRTGAALLVGTDLVALGVALAYFDAFAQGESLVPHMLRSLDAAFVAALVFGGQVVLVIAFATGETFAMRSLLLATVATAVAVPTFADAFSGLLDRAALGGLPGVRAARAELRATADALPRADPAPDLAALDDTEFARLTRRALSNYGDLPRLAASPLVHLPQIGHRLARRGAPDDALERAAELKAVLAESIARLKPRIGGDFGTADEWRYYNALYWPYIVGLKPYSLRATEDRTADLAARHALAWFRENVPERTLRNWQTAAARLVAHDLRAHDAPITAK